MFRAGVYKGLGKKCQDHALGVKYKYAQTKYIVIINGVIVVFKNKSTNFYGCK